MWKDNQSGAIYTQADYDTMKTNRIYNRLVSRLEMLPESTAPDPVDALEVEQNTENEDRIFTTTTSKANRKKG